MAIRADRVGVREDQVDIHGRVTSPSFLNELLEDLPEWTDMPVWVNGTEELLPSNNSVPVTSPILTDIAYPDIRRDNQYFTYRESPTLVDGLAKIKSIKGNTLVWNQLVDTNTTSVTLTRGHKFITKVGGTYSLVNGTGQSISVTGSKDEVFDLSLMFGTGNEPATVEEFALLFPLSYYAYNTGTLLSFNGSGIKTVSKNQFNTKIVSSSTKVGTTLTKGDGSIRLQYTGTGRYTGFNFMNPNGGLVSDWANELLLKKKYRLSFDFGGAEVTWTCGLRTANGNSFVGSITMQNQGHYSLTLNLDTVTEDVYISWSRTGNSTNPFDVTFSNIQLELGTTETSYTPFEEQTISLPISTYFPTGMKSAGTVYDELLPTKAITRVGSRTYQSGDESDTSVITDGTTTYYELATPIELPTMSFE